MKESTIEKINLLKTLIYQINEDSDISFVFAYIDESAGENAINVSASVFDLIEAEDMIECIYSILEQVGEEKGKIDLSNYYGKIGEA